MLRPLTIPGLLVTGTDTGVGKTVVAGAIGDWFRRRGKRVAVCKPAGSGCVKRREGLVSEDAEFLAQCADARHPLDLICPQRYLEPLAPAVAAKRANQPLNWEGIDRAIAEMSRGSDVMVVEGIGGIMVPMDQKHTMLDVAQWLDVPAVVVARAGLGTINHTLLTLEALRSRSVPIAGVVINRYPAEHPAVAEETNPQAIEQWGNVSVLTVVPDEPVVEAELPDGVVAAIDRVDWAQLARRASV
jgi:dethiobiotin synthetase